MKECPSKRRRADASRRRFVSRARGVPFSEEAARLLGAHLAEPLRARDMGDVEKRPLLSATSRACNRARCERRGVILTVDLSSTAPHLLGHGKTG